MQTEEKFILLSRLMDDDAQWEELEAYLDEEAIQEKWDTFHLIRDCLHQQVLIGRCLSKEARTHITESIKPSAKSQAAPVHHTASAAPEAANHPMFRYLATATAICVLIVGTWMICSHTLNHELEQTIAQAPSAAPQSNSQKHSEMMLVSLKNENHHSVIPRASLAIKARLEKQQQTNGRTQAAVYHQPQANHLHKQNY